MMAGDEIGLDAAYLVSVIVEQALTVYGTSSRKKRRRCFGTTIVNVNKKSATGCPSGRRRRSRDDTVGGPNPVRQLLCEVYSDAAEATISGDSDLVRFVLNRLHAAANDPSSRTWLSCYWRRLSHSLLAEPLSLFLRQLYDVSHTTCWHLDEWRRRQNRDELHSLGTFAKLLCQEEMSPTDILLDAINKGIKITI